MKKIIRLTENDLTRIVKRVINENKRGPLAKVADELKSKGHEAKLSGINFDFILVKKPGDDLEVTVNDEGQLILTSRTTGKKILTTSKGRDWSKEQNTEIGIQQVLTSLRLLDDKNKPLFGRNR